MTMERDKLLSWRVFLAGCEQEFERALRDLSRLPPEHRAGAEATIRELTTALDLVRSGGIEPGVTLPWLLQQKLNRRSGRFPSLEDMGLEPRIERGGLRATEARLAELEQLEGSRGFHREHSTV